MPELPDIEVYLSSLRPRIQDRELRKVRLASPFLLRSADPPLRAIEGKRISGLRRLGKRIVFAFEDDLFLVLHLMIAGRLRWKDQPSDKIPGKVGLAAFDFDHGTLILTEASPKKRASLHLVRGEAALAALDPGGIDPLGIDLDTFTAALIAESHTLKRVLTDPHVFSGIGNAYSDEILHHAKLSPIKLSVKLTHEEIARLHTSIREVMTLWTERLRTEVGEGFPEKVTAFRPEMAAHGKYKQPCPVCASPIQRIVHGEHETNYCPTCQTGGKLLADRALSRLLKTDWPKTLEEMEAMKRERKR